MLKIVESSDDQRFYFSGVDNEDNPIIVDSRQASATSLMLASPSNIEMDTIIQREKKINPKVVDNMMGIFLRVAINSCIGGSHHTGIPFNLANMNELLSLAEDNGD